jgi:hypothetical protein
MSIPTYYQGVGGAVQLMWADVHCLHCDACCWLSDDYSLQTICQKDPPFLISFIAIASSEPAAPRPFDPNHPAAFSISASRSLSE